MDVLLSRGTGKTLAAPGTQITKILHSVFHSNTVCSFLTQESWRHEHRQEFTLLQGSYDHRGLTHRAKGRSNQCLLKRWWNRWKICKCHIPASKRRTIHQARQHTPLIHECQMSWRLVQSTYELQESQNHRDRPCLNTLNQTKAKRTILAHKHWRQGLKNLCCGRSATHKTQILYDSIHRRFNYFY